MMRATIRTEYGFYIGEDVAREVPARATDDALRVGWHNRNLTGDLINALVFDVEPKEHIGEANIKGALERIFRYMRLGHMLAGEIVIDATMETRP